MKSLLSLLWEHSITIFMLAIGNYFIWCQPDKITNGLTLTMIMYCIIQLTQVTNNILSLKDEHERTRSILSRIEYHLEQLRKK